VADFETASNRFRQNYRGAPKSEFPFETERAETAQTNGGAAIFVRLDVGKSTHEPSMKKLTGAAVARRQ
jgi:hypothetical protein